MYFVLFYDWVENVVELRAPYREAHLALVREYVARGELVLGEVPRLNVDNAGLVYRVKVKSEKLEGTAFLEM